ncbi:hypothetical protein KSF_092380 [Reticulibacter mediterranei]|uniref:DUF3592 domain-containing protein n=1 Tax=Reticulibacter mediterranei TaxID=2778369 RepID=A0A8J3N858_9CHLR|nr:hypothetical protein [Reticulibacter mediterranei]GHO99190.1 hypothetical protein KSF_092380 [Reticulibacter mediterranei]
MNHRFHDLLARLPHLAFLLPLAGLVVVCVIVFFLSPLHTLELLYSGVNTKGVVVSKISCDAGMEGSYVPGSMLRVSYTDQTSNSHLLLTACSSHRPSKIGSSIALRYLPTRPEVADLEENVALAINQSIGMFIFGLLLVVISLIFIYQYTADNLL